MAFHVMHQSFEIRTRRRDTYDAKRGALPCVAGINLRHRDIEMRPQAILYAAHYMTLVFQRMGSFDANLKGEVSDHENLSLRIRARVTRAATETFVISCHAGAAR